MIRVAAVGDVHVGGDSAGMLREHLATVPERADLLLLAGDLTKAGEVEEAQVLAAELQTLEIQTVAVLGNHDHHADRPDEIAAVLRDVGVVVLEGDGVQVDTPDGSVGIAGVKGFGGGFAGANGTEFGEPEMKAFVRHSKERAVALEQALGSLGTDVRIALTHYAPVRDTLQGEPPELFPFLGSYLLAEAIDRAGCDLAVHGHAHRGTEHGVTAGGVTVRNVAQTVLRQGYAVYTFGGDEPKGVPTDAVRASSIR
ncbi:MAG TPA: metallophosphoesterase [Actinomycetota bacterium]|nr:metallophosphoesterase [Actinomycetota bacterium]